LLCFLNCTVSLDTEDEEDKPKGRKPQKKKQEESSDELEDWRYFLTIRFGQTYIYATVRKAQQNGLFKIGGNGVEELLKR
jgi:hypothetical protein